MTPREAAATDDMPALRLWIISARGKELDQFIAQIPAAHNYFRFAAEERSRRQTGKILWLTVISAVAAVVAAVAGLIALPQACSREHLTSPQLKDSPAPPQE
jgi:hypothetical protein